MTRSPPLPAGFRVDVDARTRVVNEGTVVIGGEPRRALRLTARGAAALARLRSGAPVREKAEGALARRLVDAGLAHPRPPSAADVSALVVVPVLDRPDELDGCLRELGGDLTAVVVDDGSRDTVSVQRVARTRAARVLCRSTNGGPAAARNSGVARTDVDVVVFVDSDARVGSADLAALLAHFADPCVAAVAPRVEPVSPGQGLLARFAAARSPLDLRDEPGDVGAGRVPYVPSTVLAVRRSALVAAGGFDESMRYGEDVDLVWRLVAAGRTVRYDPSVGAAHHEPTSWREWLRRRYRYGTSAGQLARRHPGRMRGPSLAGFIAPVSVLRALPRLRGAELPAREVLAPAASAPVRTGLGLLSWGLPLWWPVLAAGFVPRRTRVAAAVAFLAPVGVEWWQRRPALDPVRYALAAWCDDAAYGAGVWRGCLRARTIGPLLPRLRTTTASRPTSAP